MEPEMIRLSVADARALVETEARDGAKIALRVRDPRNLATKDRPIYSGVRGDTLDGAEIWEERGAAAKKKFEKHVVAGARIGIVCYDERTRRWKSKIEIVVTGDESGEETSP